MCQRNDLFVSTLKHFMMHDVLHKDYYDIYTALEHVQKDAHAYPGTAGRV